MKNKLLLMCLALACSALIFSCNRNNGDDPENPDNPPSSSTHIYVAGSSNSSFYMGPAVCWVDGVMQTLDAGAYDAARAVCVKGTDVYYGGCDVHRNPVIWKNGTPEVLSDRKGTVTDIKTANNKIYACGSADDKPVYWVDGQMVVLPIDPDNEWAQYEPHAIFISGNDIYVVGTFYNHMNDGDGACLWKNGVLQLLSDKPSDARDICIIGGTVYVVGSEEFSNGYQKAVMWVNGVIQDVQVTSPTIFQSKAMALVEKNGKPYVIAEGWVGDAWTGSYKGFEWYDGVANVLPECTRPKDVFKHGDDIYIAGIAGEYAHTPILLKNLTKIKLNTPSPGNGGCYAVFVK